MAQPLDSSVVTLRNLLFGAYVLICLCALGWPGYAWFGSSIEPFVLGIPFSMAWVIGWVLLTFVVLTLFHITGPEVDPEPADASNPQRTSDAARGRSA